MLKNIKTFLKIFAVSLVFIGIAVFSGIDTNRIYAAKSDSGNRLGGNCEFELVITKYGDDSDEGKIFLEQNKFPKRNDKAYGKFGNEEKSEIDDFLEFYADNSSDEKTAEAARNIKSSNNLKTLHGACFRIYGIRDKDILKEFSDNIEKYSKVEEVEEFIKKRYGPDDLMKDIYPVTISKSDDEIMDIENGIYVGNQCEDYRQKEIDWENKKRDLFYTNKDGIVCIKYIENFQDEETYFWIVEDAKNNIGEASEVREASGQAIKFLANRKDQMEVYKVNEKGSERYIYRGYVYAKNSTYTIYSESFVDLYKTGTKNGKHKYGFTEIYKGGKDDYEKFLTKEAPLDTDDYLNWVIKTHIDSEYYKNIESIKIKEVLDTYNELLTKDGRVYSSLSEAEIKEDKCKSADIELVISAKCGDKTLVKNLKPEDGNCTIEFKKKKIGPADEEISEIIVNISEFNKIFPESKDLGNINISLNTGTKIKTKTDTMGNEYPYEYSNRIFHSVEYKEKNSDEVEFVKLEKNPANAAVNSFKIFKYDYATKDGKINMSGDYIKPEEEKMGLEGAKFIVYRLVEFYNDDGEKIDRESLEFMTEDNVYVPVDKNTRYKYNAEEDKIEILSGEKTPIPKLFTSNSKGWVSNIKAQGGTAIQYKKVPLRIHLEKQKDTLEDCMKDKNYKQENNYYITYYVREIAPPEGYGRYIRDDKVTEELKNFFDTGIFKIDIDNNDYPLSVENNTITIAGYRGLFEKGFEKDFGKKDKNILNEHFTRDDFNGKVDVLPDVVAVPNTKTILPDTGGKGIMMIILAGLILIVFSTYNIVRNQKKEMSE